MDAASAEREQSSRADHRQLIYAVSHDLKTPLREACRFAELLQERFATEAELDATKRKYLDHIIAGTTRAAAMIDAVTALARVECSTAAFTRVDMDGACAEAIRALAPELERSGARVEVEPLPAADGEPSQLCLVFRHLIDNAVKFCSTSPRICVAAAEYGDQCVYSVGDNGIGIDSADREGVFGLFARLHTDYPGSGAGLTIVKSIVARHGGRVWIEPATGGGCNVRVAIPRQAVKPNTLPSK